MEMDDLIHNQMHNSHHLQGIGRIKERVFYTKLHGQTG